MVVTVVLAMGCYKTTYTRGPATAFTKENPQYHHILIGIVEASKPIAVHTLCPGGVDRVDIRANFLTGLVNTVTGGIYTPQMTFVQCKNGAAFNVELDESGAVIAGSQMAWAVE